MIYYKFLQLESIYYFCEIDYVFKTEQWETIETHSKYLISDLGRVKSCNCVRVFKEKIVKQNLSTNGYLIVSLSENNLKNTRYIHKLSSQYFMNHIPCKHKLVVNHKNFNKLDNRSINLEITTQRINANKKHLKSSSKYTGVHLRKDCGKWRSIIFINGKNCNLGTFTNEIDAHNAYQEKLKTIINI